MNKKLEINMMNNMKLRVGVLMGGISIEREVSFNSGRTVCDHLDTEQYDVIPLFQTKQNKLYILPWRFLHRGKIADFEHRLQEEAEEIIWDDIKKIIDFMYIAVHGRYAEDGTLQGFLEVLGVPYLGTKVLGSALGMDKIMQKKFLHNAGIAVPRDIVLQSSELASLEIDVVIDLLHKNSINFPCVVKPSKEGSSLGVSYVQHKDELLHALIKASSIHDGILQDVLIEEYIEGMEFSCITLIDHATGEYLPLPPTEIVKEQQSYIYDYNQKYMPGRALKYTPARCTDDQILLIQQVCIKTMQALGFTTISRIDGFLTKDNRIVIVDPNTLSGMAPASFLFKQAAEKNMNHTDLINHLIKTELIALGMYDSINKATREHMAKHNDARIRVAVLFGGASNEKEISLESGRNIIYKLSPQKYEAIPVFVNRNLELFIINNRILVCNRTCEIEERLEHEMKIAWNDLPQIADFVFIGLHGGVGENGSVQGTLEMLGVPYNGSSVLTSALCMDKYKTCSFLRGQGFHVPAGELVTAQQWNEGRNAVIDHIMNTIPLPYIVKPHDDGCSVMVQKVYTEADLAQAIEYILTQGKSAALVEECIVGMELTVGIIGNEKPVALPPSQAIATGGILSIEEKFLPGAGENQTPAQLPQEALLFVQRAVESVYQALHCKGYARIDCFYQTAAQSPTKQERVVVLEVNTLPGLTPATCIFHQAAEVEMKPMDFIDFIIQAGFERHANNNNALIKRDRAVQKQV